jgi:hypothetical protein
VFHGADHASITHATAEGQDVVGDYLWVGAKRPVVTADRRVGAAQRGREHVGHGGEVDIDAGGP